MKRSAVAAAAGWSRSHPLDLAGTGLALLYGAPSLFYAYGLDQALFQYVGAGWLEGYWPYADSFDQKPPAIYAVYALVTALAGGHMAAIRVLDLVLVIATGWLAAVASAEPGGRRDGRLGSGALLASGYYYSCLNFWNTAQTEIWQAFLMAAALCVVLSGRPDERSWRRRLLASGGLAGAALVFKYSAVVPAAAVAAVALWRVRHKDLPAALAAPALFAGGAVAVVSVFFLPFLAAGLGFEVWDATIALNAYYAAGAPFQLSGLVEFFTRWSFPYSVVLLAAAAAAADALARGRSRRAGVMLWMLLAALAAVVAQRRFFLYHFALLLPFVAGTMLCALDRIRPRLRLPAAVAVVALGLALPPERPPWEGARYPEQVGRTLRYAAGGMTRDEFLGSFVGFDGFDYRQAERAGRLIRERARAGDTLCVVGYQPVFYLASGLRCHSRFFATHLVSIGGFLVSDPSELYRGGAYAVEHGRTLDARPPTFMAQRGPARAGYRPIGRFGDWFVLEQVQRLE